MTDTENRQERTNIQKNPLKGVVGRVKGIK